MLFGMPVPLSWGNDMAQTQFGFLTREREEEIVGRGVLALQPQFHSFFPRRELRVRDWEKSIQILKQQMYHFFLGEGMKAKHADNLSTHILESIISQLVLKEFAHIINPNENI
jgi:hypothetical protein